MFVDGLGQSLPADVKKAAAGGASAISGTLGAVMKKVAGLAGDGGTAQAEASEPARA
jgi:hypothetical protein